MVSLFRVRLDYATNDTHDTASNFVIPFLYGDAIYLRLLNFIKQLRKLTTFWMISSRGDRSQNFTILVFVVDPEISVSLTMRGFDVDSRSEIVADGSFEKLVVVMIVIL
jgi:hypothetical protein